MYTSKILNAGLLHTFLMKDPNWIFMFAETALTRSVGSGAKQEEKDLCCSVSPFSPPGLLPSRSTEWGAGVLQTKSWQPWPLGPLEPACVLLKAFLFSLVPQTPVPGLVGPGTGGGGGQLGEALGKEKNEARNRLSGTAAKERVRMPPLGGRQPSQVPGRAGTRWKPEPWLAELGWTVGPEFKGAAGGGAPGEERGRCQ